MARKVILEGDEEAAARLIPAAANVLWKAQQIQNAGALVAGAQGFINTAGAYARVNLYPGLEVLRIYAPPQPGGQPLPPDIGIFPIYSGAARHEWNPTFDVVAVPLVPSGTEYRLHSYRPTKDAWTNALAKNPLIPVTTYSDIAALAVPPEGASITALHSQYQRLKPTMFSGLMSQLVQLVMGYGRPEEKYLPQFQDEDVATEGVQIKYDYHWGRCHIITVAADSRLWVVEIGSANGVIAFPLPMLEEDVSEDSDDDANKFAAETFEGLPSGYMLTSGEITAGLTSGDVIRLASTGDLSAFYDKDAPSSDLGWSTNSKGSEAHNICVHQDSGIGYSSHYKIAITIGKTVTTREPGDPLATGSAVLSLVSTGRCPSMSGAFCYAEGDTSTSTSFTWTGSSFEPSDCPVLVVHINDQPRVVRYKKGTSVTFTRSIYDGVIVNEGEGVSHIHETNNDIRSDESKTYTWSSDDGHAFQELIFHNLDMDRSLGDDGRTSMGRTVNGVRDGYMIVRNGIWGNTETGYSQGVTEGASGSGPGGGGGSPTPPDVFAAAGNYQWTWRTDGPTTYTCLSDGKVITRQWGPNITASYSGTYPKFKVWPYPADPQIITPPRTLPPTQQPPETRADQIWVLSTSGAYWVGLSLIGVKHYYDQAAVPGTDSPAGYVVDGPLINGFGTPLPQRFTFLGST